MTSTRLPSRPINSLIGTTYPVADPITHTADGNPFIYAIFQNSTWKSGIWLNGYFDSSIWEIGSWINGYLINSIFGV